MRDAGAARRRRSGAAASRHFTVRIAQGEVRQFLGRLTAPGTAALAADLLPSYRAAADTMLVTCGNEALTMSVQFADDWRVQTYLVRKDLERLRGTSPAAAAAFLPEHHARVARLLATWAAMYGNPPRPTPP